MQHPHLGTYELSPGLNFDFAIAKQERWFPAALEFFHTNTNTSLKLGNYHFVKQYD